MNIQIKLVYAEALPSDGKRILLDRLWSRGIKKADAKIDLWLKAIVPSAKLRKCMHMIRNIGKNSSNAIGLNCIYRQSCYCKSDRWPNRKKISLITAAKSEEYKHVIVLKQVLKEY